MLSAIYSSAEWRAEHRTLTRQTLHASAQGGLGARGLARCARVHDSYLVDPASSHMLVSKIKPCMSKYKQLYTVKLRTAHYISNNLFDGFLLHG